jgi:outer membrane protein assembly factor BamB
MLKENKTYWASVQLSLFLLVISPPPMLCALDEAGDSVVAKHYWPEWRGPLSVGVAPYADPPVEWSESKNVRWKLPLPGRGHSSPIVWADRIFVTAAVPYGGTNAPAAKPRHGSHDNRSSLQAQKFAVLCISRQDGKIIWQRVINKKLPNEGGHYTASHASNSPVTDGEHVFAFFGSHGLYCLNFEGEIQWEQDLGEMKTKHGHGEGSSPVLFGDTVIINWDHEGQSFVVAFDKHTGKQQWKTMRDEATSWATPIIVRNAGKPQVVISGTDRIRGYDPVKGTVIWECGGLSANIVCSPVASDGMLYAGSSYGKRALLAINLKGSSGDITGTDQIVWRRDRGTPYVPSLLLYGESLYFLRHYQGILSRVNAKTGKDQGGPSRLPGIRNVYASPVGAAGRIYITDLEGTTLVISHDAKLTILAQNRLNDSFSASAAIVEREIFLRGNKYLYCIAENTKPGHE